MNIELENKKLVYCQAEGLLLPRSSGTLSRSVRIFFCLLLIVFFSSCTEKMETSISVSTTSTSFGVEGGTNDIVIECNISLTAVTYPDWISITKTGTTGEQIFHLTASKNESNEIRIGAVTFEARKSNLNSSQTVSTTISVLQLRE